MAEAVRSVTRNEIAKIATLLCAASGDMKALCDICLRTPTTETQKIQEGHIVVYHILCRLVESQMFPRFS